jgi:hypothetical protein
MRAEFATPQYETIFWENPKSKFFSTHFLRTWKIQEIFIDPILLLVV